MLLSGCILMVSWSIMYVEIYRLTKSVWPCVIMHAIEDAVPTVLVTITGIITLTKGSDFWLNPISGVVATIVFLGIGIVLRSIRIKRTTIKYEKQSMIHTIKAQKSKELIPTLFIFIRYDKHSFKDACSLYFLSSKSYAPPGKIPTILKPASAHKLLISPIV